MSIRIIESDRLKKLPPYLFAEIDRLKKEALEAGRDIIDLGVGDPDQPTPHHIIEKLYEAAKDPANHRYALDLGLAPLRGAIAAWYERRFKVSLDPDREVLPLIGSKEGIVHIPLAFVNPGDVVLIPDPCYPPYRSGTIFAGGRPHSIPLLEENGYLPDFGRVKARVARRAKLMFLNYPNNPTAAVATLEFFRKAYAFADKYDIIVCHDAAYTEIAFDGFRPPSFLQAEGAKEVGVEFHSLSKTYNMTGWRLGFVCGNSKVIEGLRGIKSNIDSGIFQAIQLAGVAAFEGAQDHLAELVKLYQDRRDTLLDGLTSLGWKVSKPKATFYVWARVPSGYSSTELARGLLEKVDVVVTPGVGFGQTGEGYIRMALTVGKERLKEAVSRIEKFHEGRM